MFRTGHRLLGKQHHGLYKLTSHPYTSDAGSAKTATRATHPVEKGKPPIYEEFPHRAGTREEALEYIRGYDLHFLRRCESHIDAVSAKLRNAEKYLRQFTKPVEVLPGHSFTASKLQDAAEDFAERSAESLEALQDLREYLMDMQFKPFPDRRREQIEELGEFDKLDGQRKQEIIRDLKRQEAGAISRIEDSLDEWLELHHSPGESKPSREETGSPFRRPTITVPLRGASRWRMLNAVDPSRDKTRDAAGAATPAPMQRVPLVKRRETRKSPGFRRIRIDSTTKAATAASRVASTAKDKPRA